MPNVQENIVPPDTDNIDSIGDLPPDAHPILLSSKTLAHISSGLYRSTANALKELVSNAFDADADFIRINTNFPRFDVLTCSDNGDGMTMEQFEKLMNGGIGNSPKRIGETIEDEKPRVTNKGRPIIGRIGIGMLAIAQVCWEFKIVSHHRESKTAFEATLNLSPYRSLETAAEENKDKYEIGYYKCEEIKYNSKQAGVLISTNDLLHTYTLRYRDDVSRKDFRKVPKNFADFIKEVTKEKNKSIASLGDYWRLFWELSVACPIPYIDEGPFREKLIRSAVKDDSRGVAEEAQQIISDLCSELKQYNFKVILDGRSLRKPLLIPRNENERVEARLTPINYDEKIIGLPLKFKGYIYTQSSKAIYPRELRGILIRVKNVAIGDYDWGALNYETIQGFRFDWLSGEVYVEDGLEDALNIDRHSFNEVHPHYLTLQKHIHHLLKEGRVFSEARRAAEIRHKTGEEDAEKKYLEVIRKVLNASYKIQHVETLSHGDKPLEIDYKKRIVVVHDKHPLWPDRKSKRLMAEKVLIAFKLAQAHAKSPQNLEEKVLAIFREGL